MPSSRGFSQPRDQTCVTCGFCIAGKFFTAKPLGKPNFGGLVFSNICTKATYALGLISSYTLQNFDLFHSLRERLQFILFFSRNI